MKTVLGETGENEVLIVKAGDEEFKVHLIKGKGVAITAFQEDNYGRVLDIYDSTSEPEQVKQEKELEELFVQQR